jgi:hypothetical protein
LTPLGGVERPRRKVRFARLIHRRSRVLGGPAVRAAFGGDRSLSWLPLRVVWQDEAVRASHLTPTGGDDGPTGRVRQMATAWLTADAYVLFPQVLPIGRWLLDAVYDHHNVDEAIISIVESS